MSQPLFYYVARKNRRVAFPKHLIMGSSITALTLAQPRMAKLALQMRPESDQAITDLVPSLIEGPVSVDKNKQNLSIRNGNLEVPVRELSIPNQESSMPAESAENRVLEFAQELREKLETGLESKTDLTTSDRVLARITDGIYRQPSSALRELISNAYDADATEVIIQTDAPRFKKITIHDNGNGMTPEALSNLIHSIGGSIKRTLRTDAFGVVDKDDPSLSPVRKRKLIGKIGIGLFAVSQLTHHFQIITKRKGDKFRLFADVVLKTYSEDELKDRKSRDQKFQTGTVIVKTIRDNNVKASGTDIILLDLKRSAQDLLKSKERWLRILRPEGLAEDEIPESEPAYHIGKLDKDSENIIKRQAKLPWRPKDKPREKFFKLTQAVIDQVGINHPKPKLSEIFDNYLNTIWTLGLASPVPYVDKHPFDMAKDDGVRFFQLSNEKKGQAVEIELSGAKKIRDVARLTSPNHGGEDKFEVFFDDVLLQRPILFDRLPRSKHTIQSPLLFVGKCAPDLSKIPEEIRGGKLSFEGYIFWNSKIVPNEHNGVLIRIHEASGALFDETFLKYQVSEQTRLRQLTAEIFIKEGLDAALNIDRESFNYAHPHYQFIALWLHRAIRQLTNKHKEIGSKLRSEIRKYEIDFQKSKLIKLVESEWKSNRRDDSEALPTIKIGSDLDVRKSRAEGTLAFDRKKILPNSLLTATSHNRNVIDQKAEALVSILSAYGLLDDLSYDKQESLIHAILAIFTEEG